MITEEFSLAQPSVSMVFSICSNVVSGSEESGEAIGVSPNARHGCSDFVGVWCVLPVRMCASKPLRLVSMAWMCSRNVRRVIFQGFERALLMWFWVIFAACSAKLMLISCWHHKVATCTKWMEKNPLCGFCPYIRLYKSKICWFTSLFFFVFSFFLIILDRRLTGQRQSSPPGCCKHLCRLCLPHLYEVAKYVGVNSEDTKGREAI